MEHVDIVEQQKSENEKAISELLKGRNDEVITSQDFINQALVLAAKRADIVRGNSVIESALENAKTHASVTDAKERALTHDLSTVKFPEELKEVDAVTDLISNHMHKGICYRPFIRNSVRGIEGTMTANVSRWIRRNNDMTEAKVSDEMRAVFYADMTAKEASDRLFRIGESLLSGSITFDRIENIGEYWEKKLSSEKFKEEGVAFTGAFYSRIKTRVDAKAKEVFGEENAARAMNIARTINYLKTSEYPARDLSRFRKSVYHALAEGRYDEAETMIREKIKTNPRAFTQTTHRLYGERA